MVENERSAMEEKGRMSLSENHVYTRYGDIPSTILYLRLIKRRSPIVVRCFFLTEADGRIAGKSISIEWTLNRIESIFLYARMVKRWRRCRIRRYGYYFRVSRLVHISPPPPLRASDFEAILRLLSRSLSDRYTIKRYCRLQCVSLAESIVEFIASMNERQ